MLRPQQNTPRIPAEFLTAALEVFTVPALTVHPTCRECAAYDCTCTGIRQSTRPARINLDCYEEPKTTRRTA